jgi:hypothetical protein
MASGRPKAFEVLFAVFYDHTQFPSQARGGGIHTNGVLKKQVLMTRKQEEMVLGPALTFVGSSAPLLSFSGLAVALAQVPLWQVTLTVWLGQLWCA